MSTLYFYADPWADLRAMQRQMDRFANRFLRDLPTPVDHDEPEETSHSREEQKNQEAETNQMKQAPAELQRDAKNAEVANNRPETSVRSMVYRWWQPRLDVHETDKAIVVHAELPGCTRDDIKLSIEENKLILQGEKNARTEEKGRHWVRRERVEGSFYRAIQLPRGVDASQIAASFTDGVLEITVPKPTEKAPQRHVIEIKTPARSSEGKL